MPGLWIAITVGILFPTCGALFFIWWRKQYGVSSFRSKQTRRDQAETTEVVVLNAKPDVPSTGQDPRG
ncbi:MAG: hypothetical protein IBJ18_05710 [Phycisphaerales bacterium]|nr:hypothetical protein [Phycisphaerales bacterium]